MIDLGWWQILVAQAGIFIIAFTKGAFGGGFALIGIPFLSLVMDPIAAGALMAPLFIPMDVIALRYWRPSTWSGKELIMLVPPMIAGTLLGFYLLSYLDGRIIAIVIAVVSLAFTAMWLRGGQRIQKRPRSWPWALVTGTASGVTSMVAHAGGPPLAIYLLRLGLEPRLYAGTTNIYFTFANLTKLGPWLLVGNPGSSHWLLVAMCLPTCLFGVWAGYHFHRRLDQKRLFQWCYALLVLTSLKLLWDGIGGYL